MLHIEDQDQMAFMSWLSCAYPDVFDVTFAIPNSGRTPQQGAKLKKLGVKPGMPDVMVCVVRGLWHGLFIEFKRAATDTIAKGVVSPAQKDRMDKLSRRGYKCDVVYGLDQAMDSVISYMRVS